MIKDMNRRGFTITELLIVIVIMGILLALGVVGLRGSQLSSRDSERKSDIEALALHLESYYTSRSISSTNSVDCTGGTVTYSGGYTIHTFNTSGTLTCANSVNADVLVVGGGGGGGRSEPNPGGDGGGGGGAGGLVYSSPSVIPAQTYTVTVGGGGGGSTVNASRGSNGSNSTFGSYTAVGGGGGGSDNDDATGVNMGANGGSGGGAANRYSVSTAASAGTVGQGKGGGGATTSTTVNRGGSGGGGAGSVGIERTSAAGASGGIGVAYSITGSSIFYAGGGGGGGAWSGSGPGGNGGGGSGGTSGSAGTAGTSNTGGGGGGGASPPSGNVAGNGGSGGSGIVIIRYPTSGSISYPSTAFTTAATIDSVHAFLPDIDLRAITAPGITDPAITLMPANNSLQSPLTVSPQPSYDQYVYQPLKSDGSLCTTNAQECVEFNLYYRLETDNTVYMVTSRHQ